MTLIFMEITAAGEDPHICAAVTDNNSLLQHLLFIIKVLVKGEEERVRTP
jgi:hypothetical protein